MSFSARVKRKTSSIARLFSPKRYQKISIRFVISRAAAGLFLAPGLGKTAVILFAFKILRKLGLVDTLFVLAKRRIVYGVWRQEVRKWGLPFSVAIVHGKDKLEALKSDSDIYLMNYEGLPWLTKQKWFFKDRRHRKIMLCVDESSKLRHTKTKRFRSLKKLLPRFVRRYILTGSPIPNGLINLFGQIYVLDLGAALGSYITHYRNEYFYPSGFMGYKWKPQDDAEERIFEKLKPLVIRFGTDELKLPPLTFIDRWVRLPRKARAAYDEMEQEFITDWRNEEIVAANAAVASGKCRQIANGGFYTMGNVRTLMQPNVTKRRPFETVHDEKCADLVELLEELEGEPALIAYEFNHDWQRFKRFCKSEAPQFADCPVVGSHTSDREMEKIQSQWDDGDLPVLFGHPDSIAHGLNLQGKGGIVIFYSMTWNLENYEQFIQRVWRQGQRRRVLVYRILARNTVDEVMIDAINIKDKGQRRLLKAMEHRYGIQQYRKKAA